NPRLLEALRSSDLILLVGGRLSEVPSQSYTLLDIPLPAQPLVHVYPDSAELNRVYRADLAIHATAQAFCAELEGITLPAEAAWADATATLHDSYLAWSDPSAIRTPGALQMSGVMAWLQARLPSDAIICNGAG